MMVELVYGVIYHNFPGLASHNKVVERPKKEKDFSSLQIQIHIR